MRHLTYLALLAGCLLVTVPLDRAYRTGVFGRPKQLLLAIVPGLVLFGGWDVYAIRRGHWSYDLSRMSGVVLPGGLPLEEALFFVVVPLAAILTYQCIRVTHERRAPARAEPAEPAAEAVEPARPSEPVGGGFEPAGPSEPARPSEPVGGGVEPAGDGVDVRPSTARVEPPDRTPELRQ
jgi:lycopene cyclase domain-containing protein